ncbi:MAG: pyridoxal-phosphate dependent enzyme [Pseudomonadota bacterium]
MSVDLTDIEEARKRIKGAVRSTPVLDVEPVRQAIGVQHLTLKLENLQVTGSFKPRGAMSKLMTLTHDERRRGLITASGGNHGLAVAYAAHHAGVPAVIFLPTSTPSAKADAIRNWGADVVVEGAVWDDANAAALAAAGERGMTYVHPFADPAVIAGQGTVGLEILKQTPDIDTLVVAIGGGGLIAGVAAAVRAKRPDIQVIGVEPVGAPTHHASRTAGELVTLETIATRAGTLAPRRSEQLNLDLIGDHVDDIVLVDDDEMATAARWLWSECAVAAELSGAASLAALQTGRASGNNVCALICGAGTDGLA